MYIITNPLYIAVNVSSFKRLTFGRFAEIIVNSTARKFSHALLTIKLFFFPFAYVCALKEK